MFRQQDLFISGLDGVNIYRIPALIVSPKGTILAFCEAREGDDLDPTDLVLKRSLYDGGGSKPRILNGYERVFGYGVNWERMQIVLPGDGKAIVTPCPVVDRSNGAILMCCWHSLAGSLAAAQKALWNGRVLVLKSTDDGVTWSSPVDITRSVGTFMPGPGVGIQLRSGRLVIPGSDYDPRSGKNSSQVIYSDDHGKTWRAGAMVTKRANESQVVELVDGTLMLNMRRHSRVKGGRCRYVALSRDGGETWYKEFEEEALPDPGCQASFLRYSTKANGGENRLLFANIPNAEGDRTNLTVRLSYDEGQTWPVSRRVYDGPAAYSCLAVLADGTIGLLYETGSIHPYEKITLVQFNLEWLTGARMRP
jgi:sialidase-1